MNKDYIQTCRNNDTGERRGDGVLSETSEFKDENPDELCSCPCHKEDLECHSCYVVGCRTLRFEYELKKAVAPRS